MASRGALEVAFAPVISGWAHRHLIMRLARRDIAIRYRGSTLGIFWAVLIPLLMLAVYGFVFGYILKAGWTLPNNRPAQFPLLMFAGLTVYGIFAECITRAPGLVLENVSYVKKVVFPLEILPWVAWASAMFGATVAVGLILVAYTAINGPPPPTALLLPLALVPLSLLSLGASWFLASLGVYLRDIRQFIGILATLLMFLSPVVYPMEAIPESMRAWCYYLNPLAPMVEHARQLLFAGTVPPVWEWLTYLGISWAVACLGHAWFMRTRGGFADVV